MGRGHKTAMSVDHDGWSLFWLIEEARAKVQDPWRKDPWLKRLTATQAFVACVGAGPWRLPRRRKIQEAALAYVGDKDLVDVDPEFFESYPLDWQNRMVRTLAWTLASRNTTMTEFCASLTDAGALYEAIGCPPGTKVVALFVRDYLDGIQAFPIDRHVRRLLRQHELPCKEAEMVALCRSIGYDASNVARLVVRYGSRDDNMNPQDLRVPEYI